MNNTLTPVEQFYITIEQNKLEAEKALLKEQGPTKPKRGRPRKNKLYFTLDTENAIIAYNSEESETRYLMNIYITHYLR